MSDRFDRARLGAEVVTVYRLADGLAMVAAPPLTTAPPPRFGDLVQVERKDGELVVGPVLRPTESRTFRYRHELDRAQVAALLTQMQWLGATPRATLQEVVVGVPSRVDPIPVLSALIDAGIGAAREELRRMEVVT